MVILDGRKVYKKTYILKRIEDQKQSISLSALKEELRIKESTLIVKFQEYNVEGNHVEMSISSFDSIGNECSLEKLFKHELKPLK